MTSKHKNQRSEADNANLAEITEKMVKPYKRVAGRQHKNVCVATEKTLSDSLGNAVDNTSLHSAPPVSKNKNTFARKLKSKGVTIDEMTTDESGSTVPFSQRIKPLTVLHSDIEHTKRNNETEDPSTSFNEAERLVENMRKGSVHSIRRYFLKDSHTVSNSHTQSPRYNANKQEFESSRAQKDLYATEGHGNASGLELITLSDSSQASVSEDIDDRTVSPSNETPAKRRCVEIDESACDPTTNSSNNNINDESNYAEQENNAERGERTFVSRLEYEDEDGFSLDFDADDQDTPCTQELINCKNEVIASDHDGMKKSDQNKINETEMCEEIVGDMSQTTKNQPNSLVKLSILLISYPVVVQVYSVKERLPNGKELLLDEQGIKEPCERDVFSEDVAEPQSEASTQNSEGSILANDTSFENDAKLAKIMTDVPEDYVFAPILDRLSNENDAIHVCDYGSDRTSPPPPYPFHCTDESYGWGNNEYIQLPWSSSYVEKGHHMWPMIADILEVAVDTGFNSLEEYESMYHRLGMLVYTNDEDDLLRNSINIPNLRRIYERRDGEGQENLLKDLRDICYLALNAKTLFNAPLKLLRSGCNCSVTLSQEQCAALLSHAFIGTLKSDALFFQNFLFDKSRIYATKLEFIVAYFSQVLNKMPPGIISFRRYTLPRKNTHYPNWIESTKQLSRCNLAVTQTLIEDLDYCSQLDFANEYIGGGALTGGSVQEEIRFLICPELFVSMLFCVNDPMKDREAIFVIGAQRYSNYSGYSHTLKFDSSCELQACDRKVDKFGRLLVEIIAIDARLYRNSRPPRKCDQYRRSEMLRELTKAFAGFKPLFMNKRAPPLATGNWGCGAFGGDKELKSMLQLMAAAEAGRDMIYVPFGEETFGRHLCRVYKKLVERHVTVGRLFEVLAEYPDWRTRGSLFSLILYRTRPANDE